MSETRTRRLQAEIDAAWRALENAYDIEPRAYFERAAPRNGFVHPLAQALHHVWKREPKVQPLLEALGFDQPWSVVDVLTRLADAADHLLNDHDCDRHGWEGVVVARDRAREIARKLGGGAYNPQLPTAQDHQMAQDWALVEQFDEAEQRQAPVKPDWPHDAMKAMRDALARRLKDAEQAQWQPIATVPRNVLVLVWTRLSVDTARYPDAPGCGPSHGTTHWMPLPAAPTGETEAPRQSCSGTALRPQDPATCAHEWDTGLRCRKCGTRSGYICPTCKSPECLA